MKKPFVSGLIGGIVCTLLLAVAVWLIVVYTGAYNVAATEPHSDVVRWSLETTMHRSVTDRAADLDLPDQVPDNLFRKGAQHYAESCVHCHGAPGREPDEWLRGMRPEPPHLTEAASEWTTAEIHWIVENGIKMSGMPAFGPHHGPEDIMGIAAFVSALPGMSADDYKALTGGTEAGSDTAD